MATNTQNSNNQADICPLYSPSSSTSLLYHIYDQINLPPQNNNQHHLQHQQQQQQQESSHYNSTQLQPQITKRNNMTTILNQANLFNLNSQQPQQPPPPPPPPQQIPSTQLHQQLMSQAAEFQKIIQQQQQHQQQQQQQSLYPSGGQFQPYNTMHHHHQNGSSSTTTSQSNYLGNQALEGQMLFATAMHQHQHHAATMSRQHNNNNNNHNNTHHHRPLSSSGASSISGQSMALTYGRQPRPPVKSHSNLASILQSNNTLSQLGIGAIQTGHLTPTGYAGVGGPKKLSHSSHGGHHFSSTKSSANEKLRQVKQQAINMADKYSTIIKCSILLILLAFSLVSVIKLTLISQNNAPSSSSDTSRFNKKANYNFNDTFNEGLQFPLFAPGELATATGAPPEPPAAASDGPSNPPLSDAHKSKLLIAQFVVLSQNYSHSVGQRQLLAETIVKLLDQVFLSNDVSRLYSRSEVTGIRPNRAGGIIVDYNIVLANSIGWAAQQFGYALANSLGMTNYRLANQQQFVIELNSIKFNAVPDKDIKSGIVPPGLIPSTITLGPDEAPAPPSGPLTFPAVTPENLDNSAPMMNPSNVDDPNSVVWSEWSQWSSCVDKNGLCDSTRLHSRLRKCVAQHTGEKVDARQCKQRFNSQDQELEVADCSATCAQQHPRQDLMSDAPSPLTAPSVIVDTSAPNFLSPPPSLMMPTPMTMAKAKGPVGKQQPELHSILAQPMTRVDGLDVVSTSLPQVGTEKPPGTSTVTVEASSEQQQPTPVNLLPQLDQQQHQQQQQQMSCSNCTSDEICLLLMSQKVPFCAKIKDRLDESGCGGWCKSQSQLCQPVGSNAFKCIHDSECLPDEWRCHDSLCIPLSKRCDGHSNCYDNSDERDCPIKQR